MKKILGITLVSLMVLGLGTLVIAEEQKPAQPATPAKSATPATPAAPAKPLAPVKKAVTPTLVGEVVSVDATASQIVIKDAKDITQTVSVDAKAKLTKAGKAIQLSEIAAGNKVVVGYKTEADKKIAISIKVVVPKPAKHAATKPAAPAKPATPAQPAAPAKPAVPAQPH